MSRSHRVLHLVWRSMRLAAVFLTGLVLLGGARAAHPQSLVVPSRIDRTLYRGNARSVGMGGTYLLVLDDASGAAFNPALIGNSGKYSLSIQAGARTDNIPIDAIKSTLNALDKLEGALSGAGPNGNLTAVRAAFNRLYEDARDAGATVSGQRVGAINAEIDPLFAFSYRNVGALVYGGIGAALSLSIGEGTGTNADKRTLTVSGGALDLTVIEVPYAFRLKAGQLGLGFKSIRGAYAGYALAADASTDTITGARLPKTDSRKADLDLGYLSDPIPVKGLPGPGIRAAAVIRYLLSPEFSVPIEPRTVVGPPVDVPSRADFRLNPQIDIGAMVPYKRLLGVMELHNLSGANAGDLTFHVGGEYRIAKFAALRAGYDADRVVGGVGFFAGPFRLDVALATKPIERTYVGLSVRIP